MWAGNLDNNPHRHTTMVWDLAPPGRVGNEAQNLDHRALATAQLADQASNCKAPGVE